MILIQNGFECKAEMKIFIKMFFDDNEDVLITTNTTIENNEVEAYATITLLEGCFTSKVKKPLTNEINAKKIYLCTCTAAFCEAAQKYRSVSIPWGVMSGIRPAKYARVLIDAGKTNSEIEKIFSEIYGIIPEKTELALTVAKNEKEILNKLDKRAVGIYIGIPFCPSRCLYCSFVSTDISESGKYMNEFVRLLCTEIEETAQLLSKLDMYADNIYIGGGTPTTLSAENLKLIFNTINRCFDMKKMREFTLEAGRPDTITEEKLMAALCGGVDRISINPQTMNNETLIKIGRAHTPEMIEESFKLARRLGFRNINMDLIAGLPGESPEMFYYSINKVSELDPESITVHSLCVKRAAALRFSAERLAEAEDMNKMLLYAQKMMKKTNRAPYYMYRQKNISGNLENVGYAKKGYFSVYNVNIMEEEQTIIALGGGGSSKLICGERLERVFNFKDPLEYIRRFDEILEKKNEIYNILRV